MERRLKELESKNAQCQLAETTLRERERFLQKQSKILVELAKSKSLASGDLKGAAREISEASARALKVERVNVWLYSEDCSKIRCIEQYQMSENRHSEGQELTAADYPSYFKTLEDDRIIAAYDAHADPRTKEFSESYLTPLGITSMLDAPIRVAGRMVGVMCHEHLGPKRRWSLEEENFAASMADYVSLAIEAQGRRQAQAALRESEEKFRLAFENAVDAIFWADPETGLITHCNRAAERLLEMTRDDIIGQYQTAIHPTDKADYYSSMFRRHIEKKGSVDEEGEVATKSGKIIPVHITASVTSVGEKPIIQGIFREIGERKRAEEALRESERFLADVFDAIQDGISVLDGQLNILRVNETMRRWYQHMLPLEGKKCHEAYHGRPEPCAVCPAVRALCTGKLESDVVPLKTGEGLVGSLELYCFPILTESNKTRGVVEYVRDITDRQRAEEALRKSSEEIKLFAYSVAHDLKSPAVGIYGLTKLLHRHYSDVLEERGKNYCEQILRAAEQIAQLVWNINIFISTKEIPAHIGDLKLRELLDMVKDEFSAQLNVRQIRWLQPESLPDIRGDRLGILRVLRNLVDNALKHGGDELREITIGYKESDESVILSVGNDGVGIRAEDYERIFGPFQRDEKSKGAEGTGLGLAIVKEIAKQHGGKVWVESEPGKGPIFYISISRHLSPTEPIE